MGAADSIDTTANLLFSVSLSHQILKLKVRTVLCFLISIPSWELGFLCARAYIDI